MTRTELLEEVVALPVEERIQLAQRLWDSVGADELPPLTAAERALIEERLAAYEEAPERVRPWEAIKADLWPDD